MNTIKDHLISVDNTKNSAAMARPNEWFHYVPYATFLGSAYLLVPKMFGKTVTRMVDGKNISYRVQPISRNELMGRLFSPISHKPNSVWNNLSHAPQRAPLSCSVLIVSAIFATFSLKKQGDRYFSSN